MCVCVCVCVCGGVRREVGVGWPGLHREVEGGAGDSLPSVTAVMCQILFREFSNGCEFPVLRKSTFYMQQTYNVFNSTFFPSHDHF